MKKIVLIIILYASIITSIKAIDNEPNILIFGIAFNIGSFSAGENDGGSVFLGGSLSADWIPGGKTGLSIGLETGLLRGKKQNNDNNIFGIPLIFRIGWQPGFLKFGKIDLFVLAKIGW